MLLNTLSGRLLALTIAFVMLAEVLIFLPSVARFRETYLVERLERAQIAALVLEAAPDGMVEPELEQELLANAGVFNVVFRRAQTRELVLAAPLPGAVEATFDLREATLPVLVRDALACLVGPPADAVRVMGMPVNNAGMVIEIVIDGRPLRAALLDYAERIFILSLGISLFTASLLFLAVRRFITRPIVRVAENMTRFREAPEDAARILQPSSTVAELAAAERALHDLQNRLVSALRQKDRLAMLGGAVARIAHDLRNMLTTAQLLADRIDASRDPTVKRVAPKLIASLDHAIALCARTLQYGRTEEPAPEKRRVRLAPLVAELGENELLAVQGPAIAFENRVPDGLTVEADPEQLFRVLGNLIRNARQAIEGTGRGGTIRLEAEPGPDGTSIRVTDDGPGLPLRAVRSLFQPFQGSGRTGGSGLGLAIAQELVKGHGGRIELVETSTAGTTFRIFLPG